MQAHVWAAVTCGCSFVLYVWALLQTQQLIKRAWSFASAPSQLMLVPTCCCQANCCSLTYAQVVWAVPPPTGSGPQTCLNHFIASPGRCRNFEPGSPKYTELFDKFFCWMCFPESECLRKWVMVQKEHSFLMHRFCGAGVSSICCQQSYRRGAERHLKTPVQVCHLVRQEAELRIWSV